MSGGKLLTPKEQIEHMKERGISFHLFSEEDALIFLQENSYLTKVSAYRKNYQKHPAGPNKDKYIHLDFAYLVELSKIDMHLRRLVMTLCLDLEHAIKVALMNDILDNPDEDGYNIVTVFIRGETSFPEQTARKMQRSYCQDLYHHNEDALPIWVLLEIISFGDLIKLYRVYFDLYHKQRTSPFDYRLLEHIRNIRNAAAHNNCLIAHINRKVEENNRLANILATYPEITKSRRKKYLRKQFTQDFTALILAYAVVVQSDGMRTSTKKALDDLFLNRMCRHTEYFAKNDILMDAHKYCTEIVRCFLENRC